MYSPLVLRMQFEIHRFALIRSMCRCAVDVGLLYWQTGFAWRGEYKGETSCFHAVNFVTLLVLLLVDVGELVTGSRFHTRVPAQRLVAIMIQNYHTPRVLLGLASCLFLYVNNVVDYSYRYWEVCE